MKVIFEHQSNPFGFGLIVKEYIQSYFTSPFHFHDLYELIWIKKSYGKLYANKKTINFSDGDVFILGPGLGHSFHNEKSFIENGENAHAVVIFFKKDFLGDRFFDYTIFKAIQEVLRKSTNGLQIIKGNEKIYNLFESITSIDGIDELIVFLKLLREISTLPENSLIPINEYHDEHLKLTNKDSARLDPIIKYVMENFGEELDSKFAASMIHMSPASFCRYFKQRTEQTFSQFVNNVRIAHATNLLLTQEWDVMRIGYECGYKNLSYFNRQFKIITDQSPKEYREALRNIAETLIMKNEND